MSIGETREATIRVKIEQSEVGMTVWDDGGRFIIVAPDQIVSLEPVWEDPTGYVNFWTNSRKLHYLSTGCDGTGCAFMHRDTPAWVEEER